MAKADDTGRTLSKSTPIEIGLVVALCAGAFFTGQQITALSSGVEDNAEEIAEAKDQRKEDRELLRTMSEVSRDNKRRLDLLEAKQ